MLNALSATQTFILISKIQLKLRVGSFVQPTAGSYIMRKVARGLVKGHFDSIMEARMAHLLDKHRIRYQYGVKYRITHERTREVDFLLEKPIMVSWFQTPIYAIEIKGVLDIRAINQKEDLASIGIFTTLVTEPVLNFWERFYFIEQRARQLELI